MEFVPVDISGDFCCYCTSKLQFWLTGQTCSSESSTYHQHREECQPEGSLRDVFVGSSNTPNIQPHLASGTDQPAWQTQPLITVSVPQTQLGGSDLLSRGSIMRVAGLGCVLAHIPTTALTSPGVSPSTCMGLLSLIHPRSFVTE